MLALAVPAAVAAHPLGNFTINHYAGLTVGSDRIDVDLVIDKAEIPAFQDRQEADTDGDGIVSGAEATSWAAAACVDLLPRLHLAVDGVAADLHGTTSSVSFPPGAGGLSTLRLECGVEAALSTPITASTTVTFVDGSFPERIGWREIVAMGDGTTLDTHGLPATSPSKRLTAYPADLIAQPLDIRSATIDVRPGGVPVAAGPAATTVAAGGTSPVAVAAAVPGGVASELPAVLTSALSGRLDPLVWLGAIVAAVLIGAFHAVTPGHGKTVMAAYLVGTRGSAVHAIGLGLSVAVSHTLGILLLALLVVAAEGTLPPDVIARTTPVIAAISIVAIGGVMLAGQVRGRRSRFTTEPHEHPHDDDHDHGHEHHHDAEHSHGGRSHRRAPSVGTTLTWRGLFALGLTGGLVPSYSALVILLGSIVAGRAILGVILVAAFGLGMAAVMTGVGLAMVYARSRLDRIPRTTGFGRLATIVPLVASVAVLGVGVVLTWSAVAGKPVL